MKRWSSIGAAALAATCTIWVLAASGADNAAKKPPATQKPQPKRYPPKPVVRIPSNMGAFAISSQGLRPDSSRRYAAYQGKRCALTGYIGRTQPLPPGEYDLHLGFLSGWMTRKVKLEGGKATPVPTGLFRFRDLTPGNLGWTVPQKLYHGSQYLTTGYQGQTARLFPGTYTVRYHRPTDVTPARSLREWQVLGLFPARSKQDRDLATALPPEKDFTGDFQKTYKLFNRPFAWRKVDGKLTMDLRLGKRDSGVAYLATEIASDAEKEVQLTFICRGPVKAWVNGKPVAASIMAQSYAMNRVEAFPTLRKGKNLLLVKVFVNGYTYCPFTVQMEQWRSYQIAVADGAGTPLPTSTMPALLPDIRAAAPVKGIGGIVFCQVPDLPNGVSGLHPEQFRIVRRPNRARICTLIPAGPNGKLTDLTSKQFVAAMQPDLSYDAKRIVFTARRHAKDEWNIYEMNVDGSGLRQITRNMGLNIDPYYLPNGRIVFSSTMHSNFRDEYDRDKPPLLHTCKPDGSDVEQISFNLSSDTASMVLQDGRILFVSWQHHGEHEGVAGNFALCTILHDGTGLNLFAGNANILSKTKGYAQQLLDERIVFVESAGHRHYNCGYLTTVHPRRPLDTREIITPGVFLDGINTGGRYASPYPLPDGGMLVSYSPGRATAYLTDNYAEEPHMGVYRFDFASGRPASLVFDDPKSQDYDAIAIFPRPAPPVTPRGVFPNKTNTGRMTCVNPYLNDRPVQDKRAVVGQLPPAKPGEIRGVRVVEGFGVHDTDPKKHIALVTDILQMSFGSGSNGGTPFEQKRIIGYAPTEKDGSFSIEVPADTVLCLQTLDANGMAIETQLTWTWVRPGETRMCVGCHEPRDTALANTDCMAMYKPPTWLAPPPEKRRTVDFRRDIMPVIEKNCSLSKCHGQETKAGGLDLRKGFELVFHRNGDTGRKMNAAIFNHAYESLLQSTRSRVGKLVRPNSARHSPLIWRLYGKQLGINDTRRLYTGKLTQMPPNKPLTPAEKKLFVEWIDLGAQWDNILGEDNLPGYDADQSRRMAQEAMRLVSNEIADGAKAYQVRCFECHDARKMAPMRSLKPEQVPGLLQRMVNKRRGWIHSAEIPRIIKHIQEKCLAAPAKPAAEPPAKPIANAKQAFSTRCFTCHSGKKMASLSTMNREKVPAMVHRMAAKRKGLIHASEIRLIIQHIQQHCLKPSAPKPPVG